MILGLLTLQLACSQQMWHAIISAGLSCTHDDCKCMESGLQDFGHEYVFMCGSLVRCLCDHAHSHSNIILAHSVLPHPRCFATPGSSSIVTKTLGSKEYTKQHQEKKTTHNTRHKKHVGSVEEGTDLLQGEVLELQ